MRKILALLLALCLVGGFPFDNARAGDPNVICYLNGEKGTVTLYQKASKSSAVVGTFENNLMVFYDSEKQSGKWARITLEGSYNVRHESFSAYVRMDDLIDLYSGETTKKAPEAVLKTARVLSDTAMYSAKTKGAAQNGRLSKGAYVHIMGDCGAYDYVAAFGTNAQGFVKKTDLELTGESGTLNGALPVTTPSATVYALMADSADGATLYDTCSTLCSIWPFLLADQTSVDIVLLMKDWALVCYDRGGLHEMYGYLESRFLDPNGDHSLNTAYVKTAGSDERLNLRSRPNQDADYSMKLFSGVLVYVIDQNDEWTRVRVEKSAETGYVMTKYLVKTQAETTDAMPQVTSVGKQSLQNGYNRAWQSAELARLNDGDALTVLGVIEDSAFVMVEPALCGYLPLTEILPVGNSGETTATVSYDTLKLRQEPTTESKAVVNIPKGAKVKVILHGDVWSKVEYKGKQGYVMTRYLKF